MAELFVPTLKTPFKRNLYRQEQGPDFFIAESPEHASELLREHSEESLEEGDSWVMVTPSERVSVGFEGEDDLKDTLREAESVGLNPQDALVVTRVRGLDWLASGNQNPERTRFLIEAKASWWAGLPAGFLCSTEW